MATNTALRLCDSATNERFIVEGRQVYAERDGRISRSNPLSERDARYGELLAAAEYFTDTFHGTVPGSAMEGTKIVNGAKLDQVELAQFNSASGTPAKRPDREQHLVFFDPNATGYLTLGNNYRGWRKLPNGPTGEYYSIAAAAKQAALSQAVFNFLRLRNEGAGVFGAVVGTLGAFIRNGGALAIHDIGKSRPPGVSGILDAQGNIDEKEWADLEARFRKVADRNGVMTLGAARGVVADYVKDKQRTLGKVPTGQFESLWAVGTGMMRDEKITIGQVRWLYDGSLLERAAAVANRSREGNVRDSEQGEKS